MKSLKEYMGKNADIKDFVTSLFTARQTIHALHLQTKSYSEHVALNDFYEGILTLTDEFVEVYQGEYGILQGYTVENIKTESALSYLQNFVESLKSAHALIKEEDTHLDNIVDEMTSLTYKTIYKLKNLK